MLVRIICVGLLLSLARKYTGFTPNDRILRMLLIVPWSTRWFCPTVSPIPIP